jgi:hypothetical protein
VDNSPLASAPAASSHTWAWVLGGLIAGGGLFYVGGAFSRFLYYADHLTSEEWIALEGRGVVPQPPGTHPPQLSTGRWANPTVEGRDAASAVLGWQRWKVLADRGWLFHVPETAPAAPVV